MPKKSTSTSFQFTDKAKQKVDTLRMDMEITQPNIINRILEMVDAEQVKEWCKDLIADKEKQRDEAQRKANTIARLSQLDADQLENLAQDLS